APSAEAAHELGQALGIKTETVAALLNARSQAAQPALWLVDEAGLLSMKDAQALLARAKATGSWVVLVGDTKQLSAVEAGNPFKSLQAGGMATAYLDEVLRQQTQALKTAVQLIAQGEPGRGIDVLDTAGCLHEIETAAERQRQLVQDYLALSTAERADTLVLAGTNQERLALTQALRSALQTEGSLGTDGFTLTGLRQKTITQVQARYVTAYQVGDVLVPTQDYKRQGLVKGQQYTVVAIDRQRRRLVVETPSGQMLSVAPECCGRKLVYAPQALPVAVGDQLRWTKNDRSLHRRNGQRFMVEQIGPDGTAQIVDAEGHRQQLSLAGKPYVDYGWVSTTYGSQGKTAERVLALVDGTMHRAAFYVTVSRAKRQVGLYVASKGELMQRAGVSRAKENGSDYVALAGVDTGSVGSDKERYGELWQRYGEGVAVGNGAERDFVVGCRARAAGHGSKEIALMLAAGSGLVRQMVRTVGREQAVVYVNQVVRRVYGEQAVERRARAGPGHGLER
ncbi:MAG: AAA family ATPase, partial [Cyanobacteria bacterium P01_D01_bin.2]